MKVLVRLLVASPTEPLNVQPVLGRIAEVVMRHEVQFATASLTALRAD